MEYDYLRKNSYLPVMNNSLYGFPSYSPYYNPNFLPVDNPLNPAINEIYAIE